MVFVKYIEDKSYGLDADQENKVNVFEFLSFPKVIQRKLIYRFDCKNI